MVYNDPNGHCPTCLIEGIVGGIAGAGLYYWNTQRSGQDFQLSEALVATGVGAAAGALIGTGVGAAAGASMLTAVATSTGVGMAAGGGEYMAANISNKEKTMKIVCTKRRRADIVLDADCRYQMQEVAYELIIGKSYIVYGMRLVGACLNYLIDPMDRKGLSLPTWYPAELFTIENAKLPTSWMFSYDVNRQGIQNPTVARWGYLELVKSTTHFAGLQERNEEDMIIWLYRKAEIDAEEADD